VPQTRQRAVLLASRAREVSEPVATHRRYYPPGHRYAVSGNGDGNLPRWISMAEALGWGMTERPSMSVTSGGTYTGGAEVFGSGARKGIERERAAHRWVHPDMPASTQALRGEDWPSLRPATTIAGDPRVFPPGGHHVPGAQSHGAIRVSVQEAAILQTFRPDYPFKGTKTKQHMQVGNAVPPKLAEALLKSVI
jgi:DNA (cytosine-5)-methyltransferase 1